MLKKSHLFQNRYVLVFAVLILSTFFVRLSPHPQPHVHTQHAVSSPGYGYGGAFVSSSSTDDPLTFLTKLLTGQLTGSTPSLTEIFGNVGAIAHDGFILPISLQLQDFLTGLFNPDSPLGFVWRTPSNITYDNADVKAIWGGMLVLSMSLLGVAIAWNFLNLMLKRSVNDYAEALEILPKMLFAFLAGYFSLNFIKLIIVLNNDLCDSLIRSTNLFQGFDGNNLNIIYQGLWFIYAFMWFVMVIQAAIRVVVIAACCATGPIAMLCFSVKQTESVGRFWLSTLVSTIFVQFAQVLCIYLGSRWVVDGFMGSNGDGATAIISLIAGIAILYLVIDLPRMFQQAALQTIHSRAQQGARMVSEVVNMYASAITKTAGTLIKGVL